jgi:hypothetical protein
VSRLKPFDLPHFALRSSDEVRHVMQPCLSPSEETDMEGPSGETPQNPFVARGLHHIGDLRDPAQLAWEILRRLTIYRGGRSSRTILGASPPRILVEASAAAIKWGLCFR